MQNMQIPLNRNASDPMYVQIVDFITQQIDAGNLALGSVLPSIRAISESHSISKTTVSMAYSELQARGLVEGRVGQGTVVVDSAKVPNHQMYLVPELSSTAGLTYDFLGRASREHNINLAVTEPARDHLPLRLFGRSLRTVLNEDMAAAFSYEPAEGHWPLRKAIARHLMDRGIVTTPEEIMITSGAQQAISLVVSELTSPGECVVVENPCYMGMLASAAGSGVRVVPMSVANDGLDVDMVEDVFRRMRPRLLYSMPSFQNPTGVTLDVARRRQLIELASAYDVTIIEDGVTSELQLSGQPVPALYALGGPVIHCGSFSKSLLPGLRIGYAVAAPEIIRRLTLRKQAYDLCNPGLIERALTLFLDDGLFTPHLRKVLEVYRRQRDAAINSLQHYMQDEVQWNVPDGGFWLWLRLPAQVDTMELYRDASNDGVVFAPGKVFFAGNAPSNYLRLSYGAENSIRVEQGVSILGKIIKKHINKEVAHRSIL